MHAVMMGVKRELCYPITYLFDLFFHSLDFILPGLHLTTKFLDLVIQNELELLKFLIFLLQIVNTLFLQK